MEAIYERQLEVVLFSVNQYAWDYAANLANRMESLINTDRSNVGKQVQNEPLISGIINTDSSGFNPQVIGNAQTMPINTSVLPDVFEQNSSLIAKMIQSKKRGYTQLEALQIETKGAPHPVLFFVGGLKPVGSQIIGMPIDPQQFIQEVLYYKLQELAGEDFKLAIFRKNSDRPVESTVPFKPEEAEISRQLWLFPAYEMAIGLSGESIKAVLQQRFRENLLLIVFLDVILLLGVFFLYRTIRQEIKLARMKTDFVSNVSHELRTPLALIRMYAETLSLNRAPSQEKRNQYYRIIEKESERLTMLINNILDFRKMESGQRSFQKETVDLNEVVENVLSVFQFHLSNEGFEVRKKTAAGIKMTGDRDAITEAVMNLLDNAIKYSPDKKLVTIRTGASDGKAWVEVEDSGIGISAKDRKKIFDKFYRVSSGEVHQSKGSGLGLTLVHHIVKAHNGTVNVTSNPGEGSTFRIEFPAAPAR